MEIKKKIKRTPLSMAIVLIFSEAIFLVNSKSGKRFIQIIAAMNG